MFKKCLAMRYTICGDNANNPAIDTSLYNLGMVHKLEGKLDEAEPMEAK